MPEERRTEVEAILRIPPFMGCIRTTEGVDKGPGTLSTCCLLTGKACPGALDEDDALGLGEGLDLREVDVVEVPVLPLFTEAGDAGVILGDLLEVDDAA